MEKEVILQNCNEEQKEVVLSYYEVIRRFANSKRPIPNKLEESTNLEDAMKIVEEKVQERRVKLVKAEMKKQKQQQKVIRLEQIQEVVAVMSKYQIPYKELYEYGQMRKKEMNKQKKEQIKKQIKMLQKQLESLG